MVHHDIDPRNLALHLQVFFVLALLLFVHFQSIIILKIINFFFHVNNNHTSNALDTVTFAEVVEETDGGAGVKSLLALKSVVWLLNDVVKGVGKN